MRVLFWLNIGITVVVLGLSLLYLYCPPKKINGYYGHRTKRSMKSQEAWDFANAYSSKLFVGFSIGLVVWQVLFVPWLPIEKVLWITMGYLIVASFVNLFLTEKQLSKRFQ